MDVEIFKNKEFGQVRTVVLDNKPYFIGKDVAVILGYSNPRDALAKHVDDEDKGVAKCDTLGGYQKLTVINESGLYSLILSSKLPNAKKFKRWVTSEVLPSIRRHGLYAVDEVSVSNTTILIGELAKILNQNGIDIGANRLFCWLRKNGYLISRKGADWNMPTQKSMKLGLFKIKETVVTHSDGHTSISKTTKVTGKGQQYFVNKFLNAS